MSTRRLEDVVSYVKRMPTSKEAALQGMSIARMYRDAGSVDDALRSLDSYVSIAPNDFEAYKLKGELLERKNLHIKALENYSRSLQLRRSQESLWVKIGQLYCKEDVHQSELCTPKQVEQIVALLMKKEKYWSLALDVQAVVLKLLGRGNKAAANTMEQLLIKFLLQNPRNVDVHVKLVELYTNGQIDKAYSHCAKTWLSDFPSTDKWLRMSLRVVEDFMEKSMVDSSEHLIARIIHLHLLDQTVSLSFPYELDNVLQNVIRLDRALNEAKSIDSLTVDVAADSITLQTFQAGLIEMQGRVYEHCAALQLKKAQEKRISWQKAMEHARFFFTACLSLPVIDKKLVDVVVAGEMTQSLAAMLYKIGCTRRCLAGHFLLDARSTEGDSPILDDVKFKQGIISSIFKGAKGYDKTKSFLSQNPVLRLRNIRVPALDELAPLERISVIGTRNLHRIAWIGASCSLKNPPVIPDVSGWCLGLFGRFPMQCDDLEGNRYESLSIHDVEAFLFGVIYDATSKVRQSATERAQSGGPILLPGALAPKLVSPETARWWTALLELVRGKSISVKEASELKTIVQKGITIIRVIRKRAIGACPLAHLGRIFTAKIDEFRGESEDEYRALEKRAALYWQAAREGVQLLINASSDTVGGESWFGDGSGLVDSASFDELLHECTSSLAEIAVRQGDVRQALDLYDHLDTADGAWNQAQIWKSMAKSLMTNREEEGKFESEADLTRSRTYLEKAQDSLKACLHRLNVENDAEMRDAVEEQLEEIQKKILDIHIEDDDGDDDGDDESESAEVKEDSAAALELANSRITELSSCVEDLTGSLKEVEDNLKEKDELLAQLAADYHSLKAEMEQIKATQREAAAASAANQQLQRPPAPVIAHTPPQVPFSRFPPPPRPPAFMPQESSIGPGYFSSLTPTPRPMMPVSPPPPPPPPVQHVDTPRPILPFMFGQRNVTSGPPPPPPSHQLQSLLGPRPPFVNRDPFNQFRFRFDSSTPQRTSTPAVVAAASPFSTATTASADVENEKSAYQRSSPQTAFGAGVSLPNFSSIAAATTSTSVAPFGGTFSGSKLFASDERAAFDSDGDGDEEEEETASPEGEFDFEPIVKLPDSVGAVSSGEENETTTFSQRARLFRFDRDSGGWKERGIGDIMIKKAKDVAQYRILMRREQVLKVCANHRITPDMELKPLPGSDRSWVWSTPADFSDGDAKAEQLAVKFRTPEIARDFRSVFDESRRTMSAVATTTEKPIAQAKETAAGDALSLAERFRPAVGSWTCNACLVVNEAIASACRACASPNPSLPVVATPAPQSDAAKPIEPGAAETGSGVDEASFEGEQDVSQDDVHAGSPVKSGEENEMVVFEHSARLFLPDDKSPDGWIPKNAVILKIMKRTDSGQARILMQHAKKVYANHLISPDMQIIVEKEKALKWRLSQSETFLVIFKEGDIARQCREAFERETAAAAAAVMQAKENDDDVATNSSEYETEEEEDEEEEVESENDDAVPARARDERATASEPKRFLSPAFSSSTGTSGKVFGQASALPSFASLASSSSPSPSSAAAAAAEKKPFVFGQSSGTSFHFSGAGRPVFASTKTRTPGGDDSSENDEANDDEEEEEANFQPIVKLPDAVVDLKSGEEGLNVIFSERAKLFRYDTTGAAWKERGVGVMKLLRHPTTGRVRVLMRRDQVHKTCANHVVTDEMEVKDMPSSDRAVTWFSPADFADGSAKPEMLSARFRTPDLVAQFKIAFMSKGESGVTQSNGDDVIFVLEKKPTPDQLARAAKYQLPPTFYLYEDREVPSWCRDDDDESDDGAEETAAVQDEEKSDFVEEHEAEKVEEEEEEEGEDEDENESDDGAEETAAVQDEEKNDFVQEDEAKKEDEEEKEEEDEDDDESEIENDDVAPDGERQADEERKEIAASANEEESVPKPSFGFSFVQSASQMPSFSSITSGAFKFGSNKSDASFPGAGTVLFGRPTTQKDADDADDDGDDDEDKNDEVSAAVGDDDIVVQPIVKLPDRVEVKTGEEGQIVEFKERGKLYRFDKDSGQWKEKGVGDMKLLRDETTGKARIIMRRDQVHKLCANHYITADTKMKPNSERSWMWVTAADISDGEPKVEQLSIRFSKQETAQAFKRKFDELLETCLL